MKKWLFFIFLLMILVGGVYAIFGGYTPLMTSDTKIIRDHTYRFWECIKFKSFDQAAEFDNAEDKETMANKIERLFRIKPENLDIQTIDVVHMSVDRSGKLGRTKTHISGETLNPKRPVELEIMLFWEKAGDDWELKLESSL